jgi:ribulose-5-phosphate 4-epimerase/fuculose-1-phosphate aldolase
MVTALPDPALVDKLVLANRILYNQGVVDGFGHISVRHDKSPELFLLSRSRAPGLVTRDDILVYGANGEPVSGSAQGSYLERYIHSEIYNARPDVVSVIHSHSANVIPFGVTGNRLRPICHMSGFLGSGSTLFDIRDVAGNTDLLIRNSKLGRDLAQSLGTHTCVLMRGHGSTVVGNSIEQAVYRAIYTEANAKLQLQSTPLGEINFLTEEEANLTSETVDKNFARTWELWCQLIDPIK